MSVSGQESLRCRFSLQVHVAALTSQRAGGRVPKVCPSAGGLLPSLPQKRRESTLRSHWTLALFLVRPSSSSLLEKGLSLLSYQLCNYSVTQSVQKVETVRVSHVTYAPCGGWIPWRRCPKTIYRTRYLAVDAPEPRNVTDCCEGFEQLGLYCVLRESRAAGGVGVGTPGHPSTPHFLLPGRPAELQESHCSHLLALNFPEPSGTLFLSLSIGITCGHRSLTPPLDLRPRGSGLKYKFAGGPMLLTRRALAGDLAAHRRAQAAFFP